MFLTRKHLSRRTLLKGAGVSLALPLLDAMIPACTRRPSAVSGVTPGHPHAPIAAARTLRVGFFYIPHGAVQGDTKFGSDGDRWTPSGSGPDFKLNTITRPLEPYKKYVTSIGNIKNDAVGGRVCGRGGPGPGASPGDCTTPQHVFTPATWLSGMRPELPGPSMCTTLDQVIAGQLRQDTPLPSLEVASETTVQQAAGNGAPYTTLSFRDATTPQRMEFNPREVFLRLFGSENPENPAAISTQTTSLLDLINDQTRAMQRDLGPGDRAALDSYLTAVREVERRVDGGRQRALQFKDMGLPPIPKGVLDAFDKQVDLMFDLIVLAYRADLTRVASFIMAAEGTNQTYNHIGVPESFHPISHHANDPDRIEQLVKIQTWHMERFAVFLGKLAAVPDGEGTLLDNALFLYGSNMGNSDKHSSQPLPTLLVGGAGGKLSGGRHIALPAPTPIANLHLTLLGKAGIERNSFGDSTGTIAL